MDWGAQREETPHGKKIRLIILVSSLTIGGAEQLLLELVRNLDRSVFSPFICFLRAPGKIGDEILKLDCPFESGILRARFDPMGVLRLARLLSLWKPDVMLLINHRNAIFYGVPAARMAGVSAVVNWENETFKRYGCHGVTMVGRRLMHLGIDRVVAAAEGHRDYISSVEGIPRKKISVIYNGVDPSKFRSMLSPFEAKQKLGVPGTAPVVSIIAVLRPDKAHEVFLKAASIILETMGDTHFLIIGDGPRREQLERTALELKIDRHVHFLGFQRSLGDILAGVDVNVLSSMPLQETLSVGVIEAMAAGIPTVCTDVGFMREVVIPGRTGYLAQIGNPPDLAEKVLKLLQDQNLRKKMREETQNFVRERLTAERMARSFEDLLRDICIGGMRG